MKYVIREQFFYYDDERWNNFNTNLSDIKMSFSNAIRKIYDDKDNAKLIMYEMQAEHFIEDNEKYANRDCESSDSICEEKYSKFEEIFGFPFRSFPFYDSRKISSDDYPTQLRIKLKKRDKKQELYKFLFENNIHKFELVELHDDSLTIYFIPEKNEYANFNKINFTFGWSEEEKLLIYQGNEHLFYSEKMLEWHLVDSKEPKKLTLETLNSPIFQSILKQYNDDFNINNDDDGISLEVNWETVNDEAINSMNAVLDPPWFIPKQVTVEEFLKIQKKIDDEFERPNLAQIYYENSRL